MITSEQFFQQVRSALSHMDEPDVLAQSPLIALLNLGEQPAALRTALIDAAAALGLNDTNADPDQSAVQIANYLWDRHHPGVQPAALPADAVPSGSELDWLKGLPLEEPAALSQVIPAALLLSQPLATRYNIDAQVDLDVGLPGVAIHQLALRQMLLNLLGVAICRQADSRLRITGHASLNGAEIEITCLSSSESARPLSAEETASLDSAGRLVSHYKGSLEILPGKQAVVRGSPAPWYETFRARVALPAFRQRVVLLIDDNLSFTQQIERSITGPRYLIATERDAARALPIAAEIFPDIILLDVLLPHADGWALLDDLRRDSRTAHIPVIVCSNAAQEEQARARGASDYLRKPVTPERVLAALDHMSAQLDQRSR